MLSSTSLGDFALFAGGSNGAPSSRVDLFEAEPGDVYCPPLIPNSAGRLGCLGLAGAPVPGSVMTLRASDLPPGEFGFFLVSQDQGLINPPGSMGVLCLAGTIGRFNRPGEVQRADPAGRMELSFDTGSLPFSPPVPAVSGQAWNFQAWYRDFPGAPTSNLSNAVSVTFE